MTDHSDILGTYKGLPVTGTSIVVNRLGDGLSKAVDVEPLVPGVSEEVYIACRVRKSKDRYDVVRDDDGAAVGYVLVQIFEATGAMFTDAKLAKAGIAKMIERIAKAEAERRGQLSLVLGELPDSDMSRTHHPDLAKNVDDALA